VKKRDFRKAIFPARGKLLRETESPAGGQKENPGGNQNPPVDKKDIGRTQSRRKAAKNCRKSSTHTKQTG